MWDEKDVGWVRKHFSLFNFLLFLPYQFFLIYFLIKMLTLIVGMKGAFLMMGLDNLLEKLVEVFEVFVFVSFFCAIQMELKKREKVGGVE